MNCAKYILTFLSLCVIKLESDPKILNGPQVELMLRKQTTLSAHSYDVCKNGCKLYNLEDEETACEHCTHDRFDSENSNKAHSKMKIMSIGDVFSRLIANPITREELRYRHTYDSSRDDNDAAGDPQDRVIIRDVFDGEDYQAIKDTHFTNEYDIAFSIMNDGFVNTKRGDQLFTMIQVVILNYNSQIRYKNEYSIQLCIFPGKKKPVSFSSYLSVILAEIQWLSTHGMVVLTPDNQTIRLRAHCLIAGGDIPGNNVRCINQVCNNLLIL